MARELAILVTAKNLASRALRDVRHDINGIDRASRNAGGTLKTALGTGMGFLGAQVVSRAVTGIGGLVTGALDMNAALETSQLQFETLMGNADDAREHVQSLFKFAARTPFETAPIIEASRIMRTFGGDALDNEKNLTLFGDAAAATSAEINEVAFWSSRMYAAIQAGRPFGEAAQRLGELGILTPQVRQKLEDLQKSGEDGKVVWAAYQDELGRFDGAMEKQADSWKGLTSSISDNIAILSATTFRPVFDTLKAGMKDLLAFLSTPEAAASAQDFAQRIAEFINPTNLQRFAETSKEAFGAAVAFAQRIPWEVIAKALQIGGQGAKVAMDAFLSAPAWLQTAVITGWGLNKLSGGALGDIFGKLIFGGRGATPANPLFVKDVTGGLGGPLGGGRGPGGFVGGLVGGLALGGGAVAMGFAVNEAANFDASRDQMQADLANMLDKLPVRTGEEINGQITRIQDEIAKERPFLEGILFNTNVKPVLDEQLRQLQADRQRRALELARDGDKTRAAMQRVQNIIGQGNAEAVREQRAANRAAVSTGQKTQRLIDVTGGQTGLLQAIRDKRTTVNVRNEVTIPLTTYVNASLVQQRVQRAITFNGYENTAGI